MSLEISSADLSEQLTQLEALSRALLTCPPTDLSQAQALMAERARLVEACLAYDVSTMDPSSRQRIQHQLTVLSQLAQAMETQWQDACQQNRQDLRHMIALKNGLAGYHQPPVP